MDLAAAVVANKQPLEVVQPVEGALDNPASARLPSAASRLATHPAANGRPPGARGHPAVPAGGGRKSGAWTGKTRSNAPGEPDQEDHVCGTTTDQLAVIPGEEVMAVERLVAQMADLSVVGGEAG